MTYRTDVEATRAPEREDSLDEAFANLIAASPVRLTAKQISDLRAIFFNAANAAKVSP